MYDYLIVGSGLFGSTFAYCAKQAGKKCLVIDKRPVLGGNVYCINIDEIVVHAHGPHIFHTNDESIWKFVNKFAEFNNYRHTAIAKANGKIYNLPFNMNTFYQVLGKSHPQEVKTIMNQINNNKNNLNLEEQAISLVGKDMYDILIKGYTEKQWGRSCKELPASIIKRLPVRLTFDNSYFDDKYQGIPIGGYNKIVSGLLEGIKTETSVDYLKNKYELDSIANKVVYTGMIDALFDYRYGMLEYRSLSFDTHILNVDNYQGIAIVNYTTKEFPYTRSIEHKHFENVKSERTVITYEYPKEYHKEAEPYYPVNDNLNNEKYNKYYDLALSNDKLIVGGRLGRYKYYDMHQVIASAIKKGKDEFNFTL